MCEISNNNAGGHPLITLGDPDNLEQYEQQEGGGGGEQEGGDQDDDGAVEWRKKRHVAD